MRSYPRHAIRRVFDLNGFWDFAFLGETKNPSAIGINGIRYDEIAPVPGCFDAAPGKSGRRGTAAYRKMISIPPDSKSKLVIGGAGLWCAVFVDGRKLSEHFDTYLQFEVELPPSKRQNREIVVIVDNRFDRKRNPVQQEFYDWYQHGGIIRPVYLHILPDVHIEAAVVEIHDYKKGLIRLSIELAGPADRRIPIRVKIDGAEVFSRPADLKNGIAEFDLKVPDPTPWSPESPNLHEISIAIQDDDFITRFGLRKIETRGRQIILNGKPIKLLGVCRQDLHPQFGAALPESQLMQDVQIMKDLGCNMVRGAHYPQDQRFLDLCDEAGILVWEEYTGWNNRANDYADPAFLAAQLRGVREMIRLSRNHPSVIIWGFLNEGCNPPRAKNAGPFYRKIVDAIRKADRSRLISAANVYYEETYKTMPAMDIVSYNLYPGWYYGGLKDIRDEFGKYLRDAVKYTGKQLPFIVSEIGGAALYGFRDEYGQKYSENFQAELLQSVCNEIFADRRISGLCIWTFFDFRTTEMLPTILGRPRGFNNKGLLDEYRRPKMAYHAVRRIFRNVKNSTAPSIGRKKSF